MTSEERSHVRSDHANCLVACSCTWSGPCEAIQVLDLLEETEVKLKEKEDRNNYLFSRIWAMTKH